MFFSDQDIRWAVIKGKVKIDPFTPANLQNNSYLLTANEDHRIRRLEHSNIWTRERIELPNNIVGLLTARSSIARQGLFFATSIGVDAGFKGNLVVEMFNVADDTLFIHKGDKIVHLWLARTKTSCSPYSGAYQNQRPGSGLENV
jgi:deoxycytidine triphosphate deaminase